VKKLISLSFRDFIFDPKCLPTSQRSLIRHPGAIFLTPSSLQIFKIDFSHLPVPKFPICPVLIKYVSWRLTRLMAKGYDPHTQPPLSSKGASGPRIFIQKPQRRKTGAVMAWLCPLHTIAGCALWEFSMKPLSISGPSFYFPDAATGALFLQFASSPKCDLWRTHRRGDRPE